jgi:carbon monoxide dehydrogenase subunit G
MDILELLKAKRDKAAQQVNALDATIRALSGLNSTSVSHGPGKMSAAARARISSAQKARWARARGQKVVSIAPKRHISAAGLARIRAVTGTVGEAAKAESGLSAMDSISA